ncbi:MAG: tRNA (guanosine(37)-N1)-methyltransferase TrmD [Spirochaetes bacterium]|nr:tRNA (guanosine(37)-N1)-methyltransferase TrmD [Spirochaetota bacterium]
MNFYILSLFPEFFEHFVQFSIIGRAKEKQAFQVVNTNIRDYAVNKHGQVDDLPYGGGPGMVMRPEPVFDAFFANKLEQLENKRVIFFSPKGKKIDHNYIIDLTKIENIVLICGHYEGIDQRVIDELVDEEVSLGDFVLTGGEIPAMALMDAVIRQLEGVITQDSLEEESFSHNLLEYRHYTRPAEYRGLKVPEILLSGHHKNIEEFRLEDAVSETLKKRPDLIENNKFNENIAKIIRKITKGEKHESDRSIRKSTH